VKVDEVSKLKKSHHPKGALMKAPYIIGRQVILPALLVLLVSCTNPVLKWIGDFPIDTKDIIRFSLGVSGETAWIGDKPDENGRIPILITVPPETNLAASLAPTIFHDGASITGDGFSVPGGPRTVRADTGVFFADGSIPIPRIYTVRAENGSTAEYVVTVLHSQNQDPAAFDDSEKIIIGFYFTSPLAVGAIDQDKKEITVTVPSGTDIGALVPTVYYKGMTLSPPSGQVLNFSGLQGYTVTAKDGSVARYTVQVTVKKSSSKDIIDFAFPGTGIVKTVIGAIPGSDGKTPISVIVSGHPDLAALIPQINHTGESIDLAPGSFLNFTGPVTYRVTAEDGSTKDYEVTVYFAESGKVITGFSFDDPMSKGKQILGQINQTSHTIEVIVPSSVWASVNFLRPTISYFGASIAYSGLSISPQQNAPQTANPFVDSQREFDAATVDDPIIYTVAASDGSTQDYAVIVIEGPEEVSNVFVYFSGIHDPAGLISYTYNETTGQVIVSINPIPGYTEPYDWYLDGSEHPASWQENTLVIDTKDLFEGHHQLVLLVTGPDGMWYTNTLYFTVTK
jgi:hypothetical protein